MKTTFRIIAFLEGVSYILLLFIAVPIKYTMGDSTYVKLLGMPHGILFISYIIMCFAYKRPKWVLRKNNWPKGSKNYKRIVAFIVCLLFSFFWGGILYIFGLNNKNLILILSYLWFIQFFWKTIVDGNKLIIPYIYLIASILPFGTFYIDWKYLRN
ncbi:MAG: integral membrane protein [Thalassomonas sp.]|jgi:integral membrane protein